MSKKVLQVCAIDLTIDKLLRPLIIESEKNGFETHIACTDTGLFKKLRNDFSNLNNIQIDRSISPISNIKSLIKLYKLMKKEKYDIVHVHTPVAAILGRVAAKLAGIKGIVYTAHGFYFHEDMSKRQYKFYYIIEKFAARFLTDWLLCQSKEDYELAVKNKFLPKNRVGHLGNGVDVINIFNPDLIEKNRVKELKLELKIKDIDIVFSFIGRLVREKGIIELLQAFKQVRESQPNAKLLLIGDLPSSERDTTSIKEIKELMNQEGVLFLGFRNDINDLLYLSDIFVLPSYREGLPRSIIEAMAMKNAIIATNIRGCREQVVQGINGYLVKRRSVDELRNAMLKVLKEPEKIVEMGQESREDALEKFNEQKVLNKQINLFRQLTGGGTTNEKDI